MPKTLSLEELRKEASRLRTEAGDSQHVLAEKIGVSQPVVSDALRGDPRQKRTLFRIIRHYTGKAVETRYRVA